MPTLTLQPDGAAGIDTHLSQFNPDTVNGTQTNITVEGSTDTRVHGLIRFDLSSLAGMSITSAHLYVYQRFANSGADGSVIEAHRILAANSGWVEGATWNYANPSSQRWAGDSGSDGGSDAGCSVSGTDYEATAMGSITWANPAAVATEYDFNLNTTEFAAMIAANHGLVLRTSHNGVAGQTYSSDHATAGTRPKLVVVYTEGGGGATLTIAESAHGHTADGIVLAQTHHLTVADTSQAHSADGITLAQDHGALAVADTSHAHTADSPTLAQHHTLTIADAIHGHIVDPSNIAVLLVIAAAIHGHTAEVPTFAQTHHLVIHDATHGHRADAIETGTGRSRRRRGRLTPI